MFAASPRLRGLLCALAAPLCWSIGGAIFRNVDAAAWDIVFWRSLGHVAAFPIVLWIWFGRSALDGLRTAGGTALAAALLITANLIFHVMAMMSTTVANVLVLQSISPLLVAIFGALILRERVGTRGWITIAIAFAGLGPVIGTSLGGGRLTGDVFALGVAACSATMVLLVRQARTHNLQPASWLAASLSAAIAFSFGTPFAVSLQDTSLLLMLGVVQTTLGLTCFLLALRELPAAQVTLIALLEPVLGPFWTWLFADEIPPAAAVVGGIVVIAALAVNTAVGLRTGAKSVAQPA